MTSTTMLDHLRPLVQEHVMKYVAAGKYVVPSEERCLDFIVHEAGEAHGALLRTDTSFARNNPRSVLLHDVAIELFDVIKMCIVYEIVTGAIIDVQAPDTPYAANKLKHFTQKTKFSTLHFIWATCLTLRYR